MIYDMTGNQLSTAYNVTGNSADSLYNIDGIKVFPDGSTGYDIDQYRNYEITAMPYIAFSGLQGFAYHDGKIVAGVGDNQIRIYNAENGVVLSGNSAISVNVSHPNSIVFSDEYFDNTDIFPLFCATYQGLSYYRISNTMRSIETVKNYNLQETTRPDTVWYGLGFDGNWLYTIGYTSGAYQQSTGNNIILAKYDTTPIDNGDNTYTLPLIYKVERAWFECIQGSCVHDGYFWVTSGITSPGHVYAIDLETAEILLDIAPTNGEWDIEIEGCTWENAYTMIVGLRGNNSNYGMYKVTFPDIEAEN